MDHDLYEFNYNQGQKAYNLNVQALDKADLDIEEVDEIKSLFNENKVKIIKYNTSMDQATQVQCNYNGYFQLDVEGEYMDITLKKPIKKMELIQQSTHEEVRKKEQKMLKKRIKMFKKQKSQGLGAFDLSKISFPNIGWNKNTDDSTSTLEDEKDDGFENDWLIEAEKDVLYTLYSSSASCYLDQIQSFLYGGISSRFWMLRKHINFHFTSENGPEPPYYAWDCVTLVLSNR